MKKKTKVLLSLIAAVTVTACSSDKEPPPPNFVLKASKTEVSLLEMENTTLDLSYLNPQGEVKLTIRRPTEPEVLIEHDDAENKITISLAELQNELNTSFKLVAIDGKQREATTTINVKGINSSASSALEQLDLYQFAIPNFILQQEELRFAERLLTLASLVDTNVTEIKKNKLIETLKKAIVEATDQDLLDLVSSNLLADYQSGTIDETELKEKVETMRSGILSFTNSINPVLADIQALAPSGTFDIEITEIFNVPELMNISRFIGNPAVGNLKDGAWVYFDEYTYLKAITEPATLSCNN